MKLLSLIMIVRDEEAALPGFFKHHYGLFDEMVIVDTGSKDQTVAIIAKSGATLVNHQWNDDFSAARNQGVGQATGKWLLLLDADERISKRDFSTLRSFLLNAPTAVYQQKTINYFQGTRHLEWQPVSGCYPEEEQGQTGFFAAHRAGLFPSAKGLRFSGRVHESILPATEKASMDIFQLDIPVHHFGYVQSSELNRNRQIRYEKLVRLKLSDNPDDWGAMLEMASIQLENNQPDQAEQLLNKLVTGPDTHSAVNRGRFLLAKINREKGDTDSARQLLLDARTATPTFLFGWLESILLETELGNLSGVSDLLNQASPHFKENEPLLMREKLMLFVKTGQLQEAASVADKLTRSCPHWQEISNLAEKLSRLKKLGKL